jgi:nicotinamide mononucleotide transporter
MTIYDWLSRNWIEIFGAVTGIVYVFLEIRQNIWLWPVGIVTSAVYILVFFTNKFYADMSLQVYYLVISVLGWYWWMKGTGRRAQGVGLMTQGDRQEEEKRRAGDRENGGHSKNSPFEGGKGDVKLIVTRLKPKTGVILAMIFVILYFLMWFVLSRLTDSPVPEWDSFITSLSIIATWMLARKIYEHWYLWIAVNTVSSLIFMTRGLYPTVILYLVYLAMSFIGLKKWKRSL